MAFGKKFNQFMLCKFEKKFKTSLKLLAFKKHIAIQSTNYINILINYYGPES